MVLHGDPDLLLGEARGLQIADRLFRLPALAEQADDRLGEITACRHVGSPAAIHERGRTKVATRESDGGS